MPPEVAQVRTIYLDPDFRRTPKTARFCAVCQRDLGEKQLARVVVTIHGGTEAVHPENILQATQGRWQFIGTDCAERIGLEWSMPGKGGSK